jgi:serine/threonine protein kinase
MAPNDKTPEEGAGAPSGGPGEHGPPADLDYELIRLIGKGGYGEVWLVRDKEGEHRACKVVYRESFHNDRPYEREYEGICKFEPVSRANENQIKILHVGRRDTAGYFYYIMELADYVRSGTTIAPDSYVPRTLKSELEHRGRLPAAECIQIGLWLGAALENLHQHGLIHRDIKPANIIFVKDVPKLADIGLVTEADVTVSYVGTGGFIPPEGPGSPPADVYGLGKVLYEISTGKDRLEYPELPANFGDLPDRGKLLEFNSIVTKACEADARKRYASASELHTDLMLLQSGKSIRQIRLSKKRRTLLAQMAAVAGLILLVVMAGIYFPRRQGHADEASPSKTPSPQAPLPDAAPLAESEAKIRETYRAQLAGGTSAAKQQAAFELAEHSGVAEDPATQLASLRVASLLAMQAGNFSLAMQICDQMAERFHISSLPAKADLLTQAGNNAQTGRNWLDTASRPVSRRSPRTIMIMG